MKNTEGKGRTSTLHDTPKSIENGLGGKVFRRNQIDEVLLPAFFSLENLVDLGIGLLEMGT
jgi:hypothetical protein